MKVLVTGGAGYIGSVLCEHLIAEGQEVVVLDNLMYGQAPLLHLAHRKELTFVHGDARDESLLRGVLRGCDVILPLAALVGAPACEKDPNYAWSTNFDAIQKLNSLRDKHQKVIFPTTNSGYGTMGEAEVCTEESPLNPISVYGRTKVEAEKLLLESENFISLRFATVFGTSPRMRLDLLVNDLVYRALADHHVVIFEKSFRRNYIHVRDVARCFIHCIDNFDHMANEVYNCGLDEANLSKEQLANEIKRFVPDLTVVFSEVGKDPDKRNYNVSSAKLYKTGFACKYSLSDGILELIRAFPMFSPLMRNS